jgi:hypothetical protein
VGGVGMKLKLSAPELRTPPPAFHHWISIDPNEFRQRFKTKKNPGALPGRDTTLVAAELDPDGNGPPSTLIFFVECATSLGTDPHDGKRLPYPNFTQLFERVATDLIFRYGPTLLLTSHFSPPCSRKLIKLDVPDTIDERALNERDAAFVPPTFFPTLLIFISEFGS